MPKLSIIITCYFNEANIPVTMAELIANEQTFPPDLAIEYVLVNDGSRDDTIGALRTFQAQHPDRVTVVELAANVGSHNAVMAGMAYATGDCNIIISADLQDPPELITEMYGHWQRGMPLVIGYRQNREESLGQKAFSNTFHWVMRKIALKNAPAGGFDFVLFDHRIREQLLAMNERNTNVMYLMFWLGYPYTMIPYVRRKREIGKSGWTMSKKIKLFVDSILSFSFTPVRLISVTGFVLGGIALLYGLVILGFRIFGDYNPTGWTALMLVILFVSAFQMVALGVIGEYVWRGLDASRSRPMYVVKDLYAAE